MKNNKKTILVTGGAGYIGSHAVKLFLEYGYSVVVFDNLSRGYEEPLNILKKIGNLKFLRGDLMNKDDVAKLFRYNKIDSVIHFAAFCSVHESMENPELYFKNNTFGSFNLLQAMKKHEVKNIVFSSTCAVYGESQYVPVDENHPQNPTNPYGESKLMVEKMLKWYGEIYEFRYVVLRYFNVCGADAEGQIGDSKKPSPHLVQNVVRGAMDIEPFQYTCPKVATPDGTPIRDYIDVEDLARAHYSAFQYLESGRKNNIFNLGNGKGYSVEEIVLEVEKEFGIKIKKTQGPSRKGEYAKIVASSQKAKKELHWKPQKNLQESITSLKKWYSRFPKGYTR